MIVIAKLGGFLHRNCDGPPGFECLWRGYAILETMVRIMQRYHQNHPDSRPTAMRHRIFMGQVQG